MSDKIICQKCKHEPEWIKYESYTYGKCFELGGEMILIVDGDRCIEGSTYGLVIVNKCENFRDK